MLVFVDAHIISTNTDDELQLADSATPDHYHHIVTNVANKESAQSMLVEIDSSRQLWWKVNNARVTNVEIDLYWSYR